jgi:hypothetical protein
VRPIELRRPSDLFQTPQDSQPILFHVASGERERERRVGKRDIWMQVKKMTEWRGAAQTFAVSKMQNRAELYRYLGMCTSMPRIGVVSWISDIKRSFRSSLGSFERILPIRRGKRERERQERERE